MYKRLLCVLIWILYLPLFILFVITNCLAFSIAYVKDYITTGDTRDARRFFVEIMMKGALEIPSDISGITRVRISNEVKMLEKLHDMEHGEGSFDREYPEFKRFKPNAQ